MSNPRSDPQTFPTGSLVERRLLADPGFEVDGQWGGTTPIIVEFLIDGHHAQFRARGARWSVIVARAGVIDPASEADEFFKIESFYDTWPAAGFMPAVEALEFVEASIAAFRAVRTLTSGRAA